MNGQKIAYKRVSTTEQSTSRQLEGMDFDKTFEDKISGKNRHRPELEAMLNYIREGDNVFVHSMDRLARNLSDLLALVKEITDKGCTVHFVSQSIHFSNSENDPTAKLMLQILGSIHEFELQIIHERQREGIAAAKKRGNYKTGRPVKMTDEKIELCRKKHESGIPMTRIASELGVSKITVFRTMKKLKCSMK